MWWPKFRAFGRSLVPRTNDNMRANPLYRWSNRILWVVIAFFLLVALLMQGAATGG